MLNQIIYTRCSPYRDLKNKGQIIRSDGFGVFSMSQEIFEMCTAQDLTYLNTRLVIPNAAKENAAVGLFSSYDYILLPSGKYSLIYETARPQCKEPRKDGKLHRGGTFIKQCLVGEFSGNTYEWFGGDVWNAHLKSENDYYLDKMSNAEPPLLETVVNQVRNGYVTEEMIRNFIFDGRKQLVKAAIGFLINEYMKPEAERKVLLIKDTPKNVELWVAAIIRIFPRNLSKIITFSTNKSNLGSQPDSTLFYYTDKNQNFYAIQNHSLELTRHPYCMIVGYHPDDTFCSMLRQTPNSNFVIIDGIKKVMPVSGTLKTEEAFFDLAVTYNKDFQYFCHIILENLPLNGISMNLVYLYDAYSYLMHSNFDTWEYNAALKHLKLFDSCGTFKEISLNKIMFDRTFPFLQRVYSIDEKQGYPMLSILWKYAVFSHQDKELVLFVAQWIKNELTEIQYNSVRLKNTWCALYSLDNVNLKKRVLAKLFNDTELPAYYNNFEDAAAESIPTVLEMFYTALKLNGQGLRMVLNNDIRFSMVCCGMIGVSSEKSLLESCLKRIVPQTDLFNKIVLVTAKQIEQRYPARMSIWWEAVANAVGGNIDALCMELCKVEGMNIKFIEQLLCYCTERSGKYDENIWTAFALSVRMLGINANTGKDLFLLWMNYANNDELMPFITKIQEVRLSQTVQKELFRILDSRIPLPDNSKNAEIYSLMSRWSERLKLVSKSASFYNLFYGLRTSCSVQNMLSVIHQFTELQIRLPSGLLNSAYFDKVNEYVIPSFDGKVHLSMMTMYLFGTESEHIQYIEAYIRCILGNSNKLQVVDSMLALCEAAVVQCDIPGYTQEKLKTVQKIAEVSLKNELMHNYTPSLVNRVKKNKKFDENIKYKLINILSVISTAVPDKSLLSKIKNTAKNLRRKQ